MYSASASDTSTFAILLCGSAGSAALVFKPWLWAFVGLTFDTELFAIRYLTLLEPVNRDPRHGADGNKPPRVLLFNTWLKKRKKS